MKRNINPLTNEYTINVAAYENYLNTVDGGARLGFLPGEDQASAPGTYGPPIDSGDYTDTSTFLLEMNVISHQINSDGTPFTSSTYFTDDIPVIPLSDAPNLSASSDGGIEDNSNDPAYVASFTGFKVNINERSLKDDDDSEEFIAVDGVSNMLTKAVINPLEGELTSVNPASIEEIAPGTGVYKIHGMCSDPSIISILLFNHDCHILSFEVSRKSLANSPSHVASQPLTITK
ncbi:MAG: hypothetical protein GY821_03250, partial [Gammaproteobacteria bacterium]|nr:hypothetical protein [Gammaproteobacteria bacterium]